MTATNLNPAPNSTTASANPKDRLVDYLHSQFHRPRGPIGRLAGRIMANRSSGIDRNHWMIDRLDLEADHHVMELGPGPGVALAAAGSQLVDGRLVGVDHSATMLRQSAARNRDLVESGRLTLVELPAEAVGPWIGTFDRIYSMNVWQFWVDQEAVVANLVGCLNPGGRLVVGCQPKWPGATAADTDAARRCLIDQFDAAGLVDIDDEVRAAAPEGARAETPVALVIGRAAD
jgi:SAM-dependent methyltransferase